MFRRLLVVAAASAAVLVVTPVAAFAGTTYVVVTQPAQVSASTVGAGGAVTFGGPGFAADTPVAVDVTYISGGTGQSAPIVTRVVSTGRANSAGVFSTTLTLTAPGVAQLTATGLTPESTTLKLTSSVTVLAAGDSQSGGSGSSGSGSTGSDDISSGSGSASGSSLPRTGANNVGMELWLAGGLLAVGGALASVSVARRRTHA